ncbi:MAG: hypothetical protein M3Q34_01095 [bacterium]|nr:hypothetical protein [bacterium]
MNTNTTKSSCSACGTSPISHELLFTFNVLEETLGKLGEIFLRINQSHKIGNATEKFLHKILSLIGIVNFSKDIEKATSGRSKLIWEEANRRGIKMEQIIILGKPIEQYRVKLNNKTYYFESIPIPPWMPQGGYSWVDNKFTLARNLRKAQIPAPNTEIVITESGAKKAFNKLNKPLIIKPKNGSRGRHTTTNINTSEEIISAFQLGRKITPVMVAQEHLYGSVYRATVIKNELVGFFRADPPQVTGDGEKNIQGLIQEKNKTHHSLLSEILINPEMINFIKRQSYELDTILPKDKTIDLIAKTGRMYGGYTKEMLPQVHPKMHNIFKRAGEVVKAPVLGFDLIIEDPTADPDTQRWGIIECNSLPFIDLHYFALEGEPINLAKNVWDLWDTK